MQILRPSSGLALILTFAVAACEDGSTSPPTDAAAGDADVAADAGARDGSDARPPEAGADADAGAEDASVEDSGLDAGDADAEPPEPLECETVAPSACEEPAPTYADVAAPLIEEHCLGCHWGEPGGPWPLDSYSHVVEWTMDIRAVMLDCSMPPPDADQPPMPLEDRQTLLMWLRCGAPE